MDCLLKGLGWRAVEGPETMEGSEKAERRQVRRRPNSRGRWQRLCCHVASSPPPPPSPAVLLAPVFLAPVFLALAPLDDLPQSSVSTSIPLNAPRRRAGGWEEGNRTSLIFFSFVSLLIRLHLYDVETLPRKIRQQYKEDIRVLRAELDSYKPRGAPSPQDLPSFGRDCGHKHECNYNWHSPANGR